MMLMCATCSTQRDLSRTDDKAQGAARYNMLRNVAIPDSHQLSCVCSAPASLSTASAAAAAASAIST